MAPEIRAPTQPTQLFPWSTLGDQSRADPDVELLNMTFLPHSRGSAAFLVNLPLLSHHRIPPSPPSLFPAPSYPSVLLPLHPHLGSFPETKL